METQQLTNVLAGILSALRGLIGRIVSTVIAGIISFAQHIVGWFRGLDLHRGRDVPFIADGSNQQFRELLAHAPSMPVGIFEGVYNEETDEITHYQYIEGDNLDDKTLQTLGSEPLVILL